MAGTLGVIGGTLIGGGPGGGGLPVGDLGFVGAVGTRTTGTSHSVTAPATVEAGDLMLVQAAQFNSVVSNNLPIGWAPRINAASFAGSPFKLDHGLYFKVATASDASASFTWSFSGSDSITLMMAVFRGIDLHDPFVVSGRAQTSNTTSANTPVVNAAAGTTGDPVLHFWAAETSNTTSTKGVDAALSDPTTTPSAATASFSHALFGWESLGSPGNTTARAGTSSANANFVAATVVLRPFVA